VTRHVIINALANVALVAAFAAQLLRWLRVLQREHYQPLAMRLFLERWSSPTVARVRKNGTTSSRRPVTLTHVTLLLLLVSFGVRKVGLVAFDSMVYGLLCPVGLSVRGRTSPLHWTRRLTTVAIVATIGALGLVVLGVLAHAELVVLALTVWTTPLLLSASVRVLGPLERRNAQRFVDEAQRRLARVAPTVIAITGSYGKTSTKNHLADLLRPDGAIATPKSFNNRAGLSRAINEGLADGTPVFIAEMGTYGVGEIADLCAWCVPTLAIITAIGPVHLERMGSLDVIERAKFEITERARTVILNTDDPRLARWPSRLGDRRVRTAGSDAAADVRVVVEEGRWRVVIDGADVASVAPITSVQPTNVACAIAAALEVGLTAETVVARLGAITPVANRASVAVAPSGVVVIDDTFNANPASASASLATLRNLDLTGRRVVVTPGMIELGVEQFRENATLARKVRAMGAELLIVNRINAQALWEGCEGEAKRCNTRDDAVAWVRSSLGPGDAVLYLNDLPDHYP
jgi:UDP-N-acetylmuramoyl-tripeptide--D-alanyl-D-alanine ligase